MNGKIGFLTLILLVGSLFLVAALPAGADTPRTPFTATSCSYMIDEGELIWVGNGPILHIEGRVLQFYIFESDDPRITGSTITSRIATNTVNVHTGQSVATTNYEGVSANPDGGWVGKGTVRYGSFGEIQLFQNIILHGTGVLKGLEVHASVLRSDNEATKPAECPEGNYQGLSYWEDAYLIDTTIK